MIKIWLAEVFSGVLQGKFTPGEIISIGKEGILVATKDKALLIKELQLASGKKLTAWQFIQGHKITKESFFK